MSWNEKKNYIHWRAEIPGFYYTYLHFFRRKFFISKFYNFINSFIHLSFFQSLFSSFRLRLILSFIIINSAPFHKGLSARKVFLYPSDSSFSSYCIRIIGCIQKLWFPEGDFLVAGTISLILLWIYHKWRNILVPCWTIYFSRFSSKHEYANCLKSKWQCFGIGWTWILEERICVIRLNGNCYNTCLQYI